MLWKIWMPLSNIILLIKNNLNMNITTREREVLKLIAFEHSTIEIADVLYISSHTVTSHRKNLLHKLNAKNTAGLVRKGFELGLLGYTISTMAHSA
jgi:DNA-binding CsgD family transcriptional regulator